MKITFAVLAALIGSTKAYQQFEVSTDDYKLEGKIQFLRHPDTGKPYISVKSSYKKVPLKSGLAMCFDFAPADSVTKEDFIKGQQKGGDTNYPINFFYDAKRNQVNPASIDTAGNGKQAFKDCSTKIAKHKSFDDLIDQSPSQNFNVDAETAEFEWRRPICDGKSQTCEGLKMKPGEKWLFNFAFGTKKIIYPEKAQQDPTSGGIVDLLVPELELMKPMKGDFFIPGEAFPPVSNAKWVEWGNNFYLPVLDLKMSSNKARGFCRKEGGDLASVEFVAEQEYINSVLASSKLNEELMWLGYQYDKLWGIWGWTDGMYSEYANWADGEPLYPPKDGQVSFLEEPCAAMNAQGEWLTRECSAENFFLCKKWGDDSFVREVKSSLWRVGRSDAQKLAATMIGLANVAYHTLF